MTRKKKRHSPEQIVEKLRDADAMEAAGRERFGPHFSCARVHFAGMLDTNIWRQLCEYNDVPDESAHHARFREHYGRRLADLLAGDRTAAPLPGVTALVNALESHPDVTLGLLSGNYAETGRLKVHAAGLRPERFPVGAWAGVAARREDLVPDAREQYAALHGHEPATERIVVVGDTPADVACAEAHGCRSLAVATGSYGVDELRAVGADLAVETLQQTERLLAWLAP